MLPKNMSYILVNNISTHHGIASLQKTRQRFLVTAIRLGNKNQNPHWHMILFTPGTDVSAILLFHLSTAAGISVDSADNAPRVRPRRALEQD